MQVETPAATKTFADRVAEAVEHKRSQLVVGLDPRLDLLPVELRGDAHVARSAASDAVARFCCGIVDAVAFSDPYSDVTRKAKRNLLVASFICVLIATLKVQIIGFLGITTIPGNPRATSWTSTRNWHC